MEKLERMRWNDELSIGNTNVDNEHKKLLEIYNDLVDLIELGRDREEFAIILSKLTDYTLTHFHKEEDYMQKFSYPNFSVHQSSHSDFMFKVAMFNAELLGSNPPDPKNIIKIVDKWLINHIMTSDMHYENYKNEIKSDVIYSEY
jgi:hemerythrin